MFHVNHCCRSHAAMFDVNHCCWRHAAMFDVDHCCWIHTAMFAVNYYCGSSQKEEENWGNPKTDHDVLELFQRGYLPI